jgi:hypothetical membrane protein
VVKHPHATSVQLGAYGGLVGPAAFAAAWLTGSLRTDGYSMLDDAISRLAAVGADTRFLMTSGFVVFTVGVLAFAHSLRRSLPGPSWVAASASAVATLGVAALPLDRSSRIDVLHGAAATLGYITLAATSLFAASALRQLGHSRAARISMLAGLLTTLCLAATVLGPKHGLFQRLGVSIGDGWIVVAAAAILRGHRRSRTLGG